MARYYDPNGNPMTLREWAEAFESGERHVGFDQIAGLEVSTVWLGLDHNPGDGPPLIFETMILGSLDGEEYQERYSTLEEAKEGHKRAVEWAKAIHRRKVKSFLLTSADDTPV